MKKKRINIAVRTYAVIAILLIICFLAIYNYTLRESSKLRCYEYTSENLTEAQDGISIAVSITKQWDDEDLHPDTPAGAQYDGVLTNNSGYRFKNWTASMTFSKETWIDSSWNGDFSVDGKVVNFTATGDPANVAAHTNATFGAIMYATDFMSLESCTITGYRIITLQDVAAFKLLVAVSFIWLIAMTIHLITYRKMAEYKKRQELDSEIIKQSMNTFTGFIDAKDAYTKGHSARVAEYAAEIGRRMKMDKEEVEKIYYITLMHDCGKIGVPDAVLKKPGKLTDEEFKEIKAHTTLGDSILINFTAIPGIRDGAHYHHERYDGKGYPSGLKGTDIPLYARMICVADSYDAMSSNRCYRRHLDKSVILKELADNEGKQFDPDIVPIMIEMIEDGFTERVQAKYPSVETSVE